MAEMTGSGLTGQHEVALKLLTEFLVTALKLGELGFQRAERPHFFLIGNYERPPDDFGAATDLADDLQNEIVHRTGRDTPQGASGGSPVLADLVAGVIKVGISVLVLLSSRLGSEAVAANAAANQAFEHGLMLVAVHTGMGQPLSDAEGVVGSLPQFGAHERRMLAGVILPVMPDHAFVDGIGDDPRDLIGNEPLATDELFAPFAGVNETLRGSQALAVENGGDLGGAL